MSIQAKVFLGVLAVAFLGVSQPHAALFQSDRSPEQASRTLPKISEDDLEQGTTENLQAPGCVAFMFKGRMVEACE